MKLSFDTRSCSPGRVSRHLTLLAYTATVLLSCFSASALDQASLSILQNAAGEKVVLDASTGTVWVWDLSLQARRTYDQQIAGIQQLNATTYFDLAGWHMATATEMQPLLAQSTDVIRQTFHPSHERYDGIYEWHYWSGRYESGSAGIHQAAQTAWGNFAFGPFNYPWPGIVNLSDAGDYIESSAWVVTTIPEPTTGAMFIVAAVAIALRRGRR